MASLDPDNAEWQRELCRTRYRIGEVHEAQGNLAGAQGMFRKDLAISERLAAQKPDAGWQRGLGVSYARVGHVSSRLGETAAAESALSGAVDVEAEIYGPTPKLTTNLAGKFLQ